MGFRDGIKAIAEKAAAQAERAAIQAKENHVTLQITSGKNYLNLNAFTDSIVLRQNAEGKIYFDNVDGFFEIVDYQWEGPRYKTVATSDTTEVSKGKDKTKRKGGLGGALIGTALMPGVGTAIGYMASSRKETKSKGNSKVNTVASEEDVEVPGNAKMTLRNIGTGATFVIGFSCDTALDGEIVNFNVPRVMGAGEAEQKKSNVQLLKEYKDLLDMGVITQEEFDQKKHEILGL